MTNDTNRMQAVNSNCKASERKTFEIETLIKHGMTAVSNQLASHALLTHKNTHSLPHMHFTTNMHNFTDIVAAHLILSINRADTDGE